MDILTEGTDLENAIDMARDAIGLKGIAMQDDGEEIPKPSKLEELHIENGTFADESKGIISLVDIDFDVYRGKVDNKTVRRNVTLPNWLNQEAEEANLNVSRVLQDVLMQKLNVYR